MTTVKIIIPWREGCPNREANLGAVKQWWTEHHPDWPVHLGHWGPDKGPWRKGCAVKQAMDTSDPTDVVVVADADVIIPGIYEAIEALETRRYEWAVPQRMIYRLTPDATNLVVEGKLRLPSIIADSREYLGMAELSVATPGGGAVALTSEALSKCPMDPRFAGYGHEDHSWARALYMLSGAPYQVVRPLWHLWHPPQDRLCYGNVISRGIGSVESMQLWTRYRTATTRPLMEALLREARDYGTDAD
jgi:hypothetical protein